MTKTRKAKTRQERLQERRLLELKRKEQDSEDPLDDEVDDEEEVVDPAADNLKKQLDEIEKDMGEYAMPMPTAAPTSFDELDAARNAQEKADEIAKTGYDVQCLVRNILNSPEMDAEEQSVAIKEVGSGFEQRVSSLLNGDGEEVEKEVDPDLLALQNLIAYDKRHSNPIAQLIDKAKVSYASRENMPDSNFALVTTRDGKKIRKYLIHDKAHVRNALARAAQQIEAGGQGASDARAALPKIHAAAKRMGIGMDMKKEKSAILIEKDANGDWRWVGWVSNNFQDRSGDIIIESAHQEYVDWVNKDLPNRAPVFTSCHAPGTVRENQVDFVAYENGFLVMSGKLTEKETQSLMLVSKECDIGMSHTGWGLRDQADVRQIVKYRCFEVTDLPVESADNPFTTMEVFSKEVDMDQLAYLSALLGSKEKAEAALKLKTSLAQKELTEAGVESKEKPQPVTEQTPPAPDDVVKKAVEQVVKELDIPALNEFVIKAQEAMEKVEALELALKERNQSEDERLAEKISPPAGTVLAWSKSKRSSESTETVIPEDDALLKEVPEVPWLSMATGTKPIK